MAPFTPYQNTPDPKEYGKPKEIDVGRQTSMLGAGLNAAGQLIDAGLKVTDNLIKESADKQLFEEINLKKQQNTAEMASLLNPQTPSTANTEDYSIVGDQPTPPPPAVAAADRRMGIIAQANRMGHYNDIQFYGEMQEITQRISSQYPGGYARWIQDRATHWIGRPAADAQRTAIQTTLQQLAATQKGDAEKWSNELERDRALFRNPDGTFDERGYYAALNTTDPDTRNRIRVHLGRQAFIEHNYKVLKDQFELELSSGNVSNQRALKHYSDIAAYRTAEYTSRAQFQFMGRSMRIADINEFIERTRKAGGNVDPTALAQLGAQVGRFYEGLEKQLQAEELRPYGGNRTLQGLVKDKAELEKIRKHHLDMTFGSIIKNVGEGNLHLSTSMLNTSAGRQELAAFRFIENEVTGAWVGLEKGVGGHVAAAIVNNQLNKMTAYQLSELSEVTKRIRMQQIAASKNFGSLMTSLEHFNMLNPMPGGVLTPEQERERANYIRHELDTVKDFITQKDAPVKDFRLAVRGARVIINPQSTEFFNKFNKDQQMQVYANVNSPDVAKEIKELSRNDPQLWKDYVDWNYYTFKRLHNTQIASLQQGVADTAGTNFTWTENGQIAFRNRSNTLQGAINSGSFPASTTSIQAINNINAGLSALKIVAELNGDKLTPEFLKQFGINLAPPAEPVMGTPRQGKRTSGAPNGSGGGSRGLPILTFDMLNPVSSAQAAGRSQDTLQLPNRFDETFTSVPDMGVNEPLQQFAASLPPPGNIWEDPARPGRPRGEGGGGGAPTGIQKYEIIDTETGRAVGNYNTPNRSWYNRAIKRLEKLNQGGDRYQIRPVLEQPSPLP